MVRWTWYGGRALPRVTHTLLEGRYEVFTAALIFIYVGILFTEYGKAVKLVLNPVKRYLAKYPESRQAGIFQTIYAISPEIPPNRPPSIGLYNIAHIHVNGKVAKWTSLLLEIGADSMTWKDPLHLPTFHMVHHRSYIPHWA